MHLVEGVVSFGRPGASPALMEACAQAGIALSFLSPQGKFLARVEGPRTGNVLLRRAQYRAADNPQIAVPVVRGIVTAKAANQRIVLQRALRDHGDTMPSASRSALEKAENRLGYVARRAAFISDLDTLRGHEGDAAKLYFSAFDGMIQRNRDVFFFQGRSRRPPLDRVNALLSFLYAMLGHDCRSALEGVGLDPQVGLFHADRPGRASLALDLMEELRPVMADRMALSLVNRGQVQASDFLIDEGGAVSLTEDGRKTVLVAWQERKTRVLRHPFLGETMPLGLVPHIQALLLSRHLRGDLDGYPSFLWK
jgi:CRISPR-associated protein Cas1